MAQNIFDFLPLYFQLEANRFGFTSIHADYCRSKEHEESEEQLLRICQDLPACQSVPSSVGCKALPHAIIQRHVVGSVPRRRTRIEEGKTTEWDIRHGAPAPPKISPSFVSGATRALLFPPRPSGESTVVPRLFYYRNKGNTLYKIPFRMLLINQTFTCTM